MTPNWQTESKMRPSFDLHIAIYEMFAHTFSHFKWIFAISKSENWWSKLSPCTSYSLHLIRFIAIHWILYALQLLTRLFLSFHFDDCISIQISFSDQLTIHTAAESLQHSLYSCLIQCIPISEWSLEASLLFGCIGMDIHRTIDWNLTLELIEHNPNTMPFFGKTGIRSTNFLKNISAKFKTKLTLLEILPKII